MGVFPGLCQVTTQIRVPRVSELSMAFWGVRCWVRCYVLTPSCPLTEYAGRVQVQTTKSTRWAGDFPRVSHRQPRGAEREARNCSLPLTRPPGLHTGPFFFFKKSTQPTSIPLPPILATAVGAFVGVVPFPSIRGEDLFGAPPVVSGQREQEFLGSPPPSRWADLQAGLCAEVVEMAGPSFPL